jgi:hypothetical protein
LHHRLVAATVRGVPPPTLGAAIATGFRAAARQPWLLAVGLVVAGARRALGIPAVVVALVIVARAASEGLRAAPFPFGAALRAVADAVTAPRFLALVAGLWLAGALLGAALRVAYLAGALPTLAAGVNGQPAGPRRFAAGVAYELPSVLGAAALGFVADLAATIFGAAIGLGALRITVHAAQHGGSPLLAAAVAFAATLAIAVSLLVSVLADAAVTRAAIAGEGPVEAFASAAARVGRRPAAFLLAAVSFALLAAAGAASVQAGGSAFLGVVARAGPILIGPQAMLATASALVAAAVDLWALGTIAALACADG